MTYNEFVKQPNNIRRRVNHKIEDVMLKESICMRSTISLGERVQASPGNSQEASYIRYIDAKNELNDLAARLEEARTEVRTFLYDNLSLEDADLLEWRYIDGKTPMEISEKMGTTYEATRQRLKRANEKARKKYIRRENQGNF